MATAKSQEKNKPLIELFDQHRDALKHFVSKKLHQNDGAEDVVQETFIRLMESERKKGQLVSSMASPEAYMYRVASNLAIDRLRQQHSRVDAGDREELTDDITDGFEPMRYLAASERIEQLREAVANLPPKCRQVFMLHKYRQLSYRQVAEHLDISVSMVEKHMMKALTRLDHSLGGRS